MDIYPAQRIFNTMSGMGSARVNDDTLALLQVLVSSGLMSMDDRVDTALSTLPFKQALLEIAEPGVYMPSFYTPQAASQLLELDREFFLQDDPGNPGQLWLQANLVGWTRQEDRQRAGFGSYNTDKIDKWACVVMESLPEKQKQNTAIWEAALRLGLKSTAVYMAAHLKDGWMSVGENGKPLLVCAHGGWAWICALANGLDPHAPSAGGGTVLARHAASCIFITCHSWVCSRHRRKMGPH